MLSFAGCLPIFEASAALHVRHCVLQYQATDARHRSALASRDASRVPRLGLEYEIARLDAERVWVFGLIEEIDAGWPTPVKAQHFPTTGHNVKTVGGLWWCDRHDRRQRGGLVGPETAE
ncbi:hypothetical protein [Pseudonocardia yunnanensis]|uniref:Uncharacterized protein n=1 Tax=Pseudonocardia yunnanensis TaxID=58107 RepID=A0ABW4EUS0_9PSEU